MTKLYHAPIEVETSDGQPHRFKWRNQWHEIKTIYGRSTVQSDWWRQEVNRAHYSIECEGLALYDIYRQGDGWFLERVWD